MLILKNKKYIVNSIYYIMPKNKRVVKIKGKKSKEVMKMIKDGELTTMFNQMLGVEAADPEIVLPRYKKCQVAILALASYMKKFSENQLLSDLFSDEVENFKKINKFSSKLNNLIENKSENKSAPTNNIAKLYSKLKKHDTTRALFVVYSQIRQYREYIEDQKKLNDIFITEELGYELYPFKKICKMNLYNMWSKTPPKDAKEYILKFLHQVYKLTKHICETLMQADVNISNFSEILVSCITEAKKLIPNCNDAFKRIENAVGLLETNFNDYYKDFIKTENPSIIFLNFIGDVSNEQKKTDMKLIVQFRKIINHFQKATQGQANDPQMKEIFKKLNMCMNTFDKSPNEKKNTSSKEKDSNSYKPESTEQNIEQNIEQNEEENEEEFEYSDDNSEISDLEVSELVK